METAVFVMLVLAAVAGVVALEARKSVVSLAAMAVVFALAAASMLAAGAVEPGVGALIGGAVLVLVLRWAFNRTGKTDEVARLAGGPVVALGILTLAAVAAVAVLAAGGEAGTVKAASEHAGSAAGLAREMVVVLAALAGVWAMLRKTGRRDE